MSYDVKIINDPKIQDGYKKQSIRTVKCEENVPILNCSADTNFSGRFGYIY